MGIAFRTGRRARVILAVLVLPILSWAGPVDAQRGPVITGVERVVAVGDLHGAYDAFVAILQGTSLLGPDLSWTGGKAHLVQIGDVLDRGDGARKIFDLIRRLEGEAEAAGGRSICSSATTKPSPSWA